MSGPRMVLAALLAFAGVAAAAGPDRAAARLERVRNDEARRVAVLRQAAQAVVCIYGERTRAGGGSGVLIDAAGYGLTNFHVVADFLESGGYGGLSDGKLYPLTVLGIDPGGDVAMFKLEGRAAFPYAPLGDSESLELGQWVAALGNPFVLSEDYHPTITLGVVSGLHRYQEGQNNLLEYADCIQVSTSINPGNSGGPLFDLKGNIVGINGRGSFEERGRVNVGLGYAITERQIRRFIPALRAGLITSHGTLGATVRRAGADLIFDSLQQLSPAEKAGIQLGDVLVSIDGRKVQSPNDFNNRIAVLPADWPVEVTVQRNAQMQTQTARLEALPVRLGAAFVPKPRHAADAARWYLGQARVQWGATAPDQTLEIVLQETQTAAAAPPLTIILTADQMTVTRGSVVMEHMNADAAWMRELQTLLRPLLSDLDLVDLAVVGADRVGDEAAAVLVGEAEVRWHIGDSSRQLRWAELGGAEPAEVVSWSFAACSDNPNDSGKRTWTRTAGEDRREFEVLELRWRTAAAPEDGA